MPGAGSRNRLCEDDSEVEPSRDDVIGLCLGTGIVFSFREKMEQSMPVVPSLFSLLAKPLLYTSLAMVSKIFGQGDLRPVFTSESSPGLP